MTHPQLTKSIFKLTVALFAMVGLFGAFKACQAQPEPTYAIQKAVYYYPEPVDRYHDTTMSYGMRRVYNEYYESK